MVTVRTSVAVRTIDWSGIADSGFLANAVPVLRRAWTSIGMEFTPRSGVGH